MGCICHYCLSQREARPSLAEIGTQRGIEKRELKDLQKQQIHEKCYSVIEMYEDDWWKMNKTDINVEQHVHESLPYKIPLRNENHLETFKSGNLFGYVQCDIEVPENLREVFPNFPPIFKNNIVGRDVIDPFMKEFPEKEGLLTHPRRMLNSNFFLENGTVITPLLLFYLDLGLVCRKSYPLCNILQ